YPAQSQRRWAIWLHKQRLEDHLPNEFDVVITAIRGFADPVILGTATGRTWTAARLRWESRAQLAE
ncbi:MAG TPA: hypothetical protein VH502_04370, partial [Actinoplanes sp.]